MVVVVMSWVVSVVSVAVDLLGQKDHIREGDGSKNTSTAQYP